VKQRPTQRRFGALPVCFNQDVGPFTTRPGLRHGPMTSRAFRHAVGLRSERSQILPDHQRAFHYTGHSRPALRYPELEICYNRLTIQAGMSVYEDSLVAGCRLSFASSRPQAYCWLSPGASHPGLALAATGIADRWYRTGAPVVSAGLIVRPEWVLAKCGYSSPLQREHLTFGVSIASFQCARKLADSAPAGQFFRTLPKNSQPRCS